MHNSSYYFVEVIGLDCTYCSEGVVVLDQAFLMSWLIVQVEDRLILVSWHNAVPYLLPCNLRLHLTDLSIITQKLNNESWLVFNEVTVLPMQLLPAVVFCFHCHTSDVMKNKFKDCNAQVVFVIVETMHPILIQRLGQEPLNCETL